MNETELIRACVRNDTNAQHTLFEKYAGILMTICRRYAGDQHEAEDMLQEAFISIFSHINQFKYAGSFEGWLKRITVNTAIKILQKRKVRVISISNVEFEMISPDFNILSDLNTEDLLKLISQLPDGYRMIFNLYVIEGYSHDEIAAMLKIKTATSRSQLSKARAILKDKINLLQKIPG
ncbi:MAG TPA: RNA polymerase sigma factor [Puia sp.]|nr:RNA polymerase sigma factor [Puia sp.]